MIAVRFGNDGAKSASQIVGGAALDYFPGEILGTIHPFPRSADDFIRAVGTVNSRTALAADCFA